MQSTFVGYGIYDVPRMTDDSVVGNGRSELNAYAMRVVEGADPYKSTEVGEVLAFIANPTPQRIRRAVFFPVSVEISLDMTIYL